MELQHIDLNQLKTSPMNVRKHGGDKIDDLLPSIRAHGVLQPLLVRPNCEGFEIVAGQRRFNACKVIAEERGAFDPIPCILMQQEDDAIAIEASLSENIARLPMDEIDQYEAFRDLVKEGRSVADIADHFGVTDRLVKQCLALANLHPPILNAFRKEDILGADMRILTMATIRQQKAWYKLLKSKHEYAPTGYQLKSWLFGGKEIPVSNALFDVAESGLAIISDLFGEDSYFADDKKFWKHQSNVVAQRIEDYKAEGWQSVILHDVGDRWTTWDCVKAAQAEGAEVHITCAADGEIKFHEGYISEKEYKKRQKAAGKGEAAPARCELTKPMQNYLALHRHAAVRRELLDHAGIALRLAVAQIIAGSFLGSVKAEAKKANSDAIAESLKSNKAEDRFAEERTAVRALLGWSEETSDTLVPRRDDWEVYRNPHSVFTKLVSLDDAAVNRILVFVTAETLPSGSAMVEMLGDMLSVDMAECWKPDETFFDLMRDKEAINAILKHANRKATAEANIASTAKVQKQIIQDGISGKRKDGKEGWQPRYMRFPMQDYTHRGGIESVNQAEDLKKALRSA